MPVDGVFRPTTKRSKRRAPLRPVDENRSAQDPRTDEEVLAGKVIHLDKLMIIFSYLSIFRIFESNISCYANNSEYGSKIG